MSAVVVDSKLYIQKEVCFRRLSLSSVGKKFPVMRSVKERGFHMRSSRFDARSLSPKRCKLALIYFFEYSNTTDLFRRPSGSSTLLEKRTTYLSPLTT